MRPPRSRNCSTNHFCRPSVGCASPSPSSARAYRERPPQLIRVGGGPWAETLAATLRRVRDATERAGNLTCVRRALYLADQLGNLSATQAEAAMTILRSPRLTGSSCGYQPNLRRRMRDPGRKLSPETTEARSHGSR